MGFFSNDDRKVSGEEFKDKVLPRLGTKGFSDDDKRKVKIAFGGTLTGEHQRGVDAKEINSKIQDMRARPGVYGLSSKEVDTLEKTLKENL